MCSPELLQKIWVENRQSSQVGGGGGVMWKVKDPCSASSSSSIQLAGQAEKDTLTSCLY